MKNCPLPLPLRPLLLLALAGLPAPRVPGATILPLGDLPGGGFASQGIRISNDGGVVVGMASVGLFTSAAFRWTFDTGTVSLNGVPGSWPNGISSDGSVVAGNDGNAVFRWTLGGGNEEPAGIPQSSLAKDLSADGSTIVGASPGNVAFRWDPVGGLTSLGTLPGHAISRADGVSADGSVPSA